MGFFADHSPPVIKVGNCVSRVETTERGLLLQLDRTMAIPFPGAAYMMRARPGFDGMWHPFDCGSGKFPTGLVGNVRKIIPTAAVEDLRERPPVLPFNPNILGMPLRDYQSQSVKIVFATDRGVLSGRGVLELAMAAGKTITALAIAAHIPGKCVIILHRKDLLHQWREEIQKIMHVEAACIGDGAWDDRIGEPGTKFVIAMPQTIGKSLMEFRSKIEDVKLLIIDEAARMGASTWYAVAQHVPAYFRVGLSVGGDSMILVEGPSGAEHLRIDEFYTQIANDDTEGTFVPIEGYKVRAFDGTQFVWKHIRSILKHKLEGKKAFRVTTEKGKSLLMTEDHSTYRVVPSGHYKCVNQTKRPYPQLKLKKSTELEIGDYLLAEDKTDITMPITHLDLTNYLGQQNWFLASPKYEQWVRTANPIRRHNVAKQRIDPYITRDEFNANPSLQDVNGKMRLRGGDHWCHKLVPVEAIAYLLGFYIGDGWITNDVPAYAVETKQIPSFTKIAKSRLTNTLCSLHIKIRDRAPRNCSEILLSNSLLGYLFKKLTGGAHSWQKRIPKEVFSFSNEMVREFIAGMLDSDGHFSSVKNKRRWYYVTTSKALALDLVELLKRLNVSASVHSSKPQPGGFINGKQIIGRRHRYSVHFSDYSWRGDNNGWKGKRNTFVMDHMGGDPVAIKSIVEETTDYVYDISVDDDQWQTFVASGILVHNTGTIPEDPVKAGRLKATTGNVLVKAGAVELAKMGYLSPCTVILHRITNPGVFGNWHTIRRQLIEDNAGRNNAIVEITVAEVEKGKRILIFFDTIRHAKIIMSMLVAKEIDARLVTGKESSADRNEARSDLKTGRLSVACVSTVWIEGVDLPALDVVVLAAGGKSSAYLLQRLGRALRKAPGKTEAIIHDFHDTGNKYVLNHSMRRQQIIQREKFAMKTGKIYRGEPGQPPQSVVDDVEVHEPPVIEEE